MTNSFEDTPVYSTRSHSYIFNSKGPQIYHSSIIIAPTPSAAARAVAEKDLQDIYKQELKDHKQEYIYKVALNQATLKVFNSLDIATADSNSAITTVTLSNILSIYLI